MVDEYKATDGDPLPEIVAAPAAPSAQVPVFLELHVPQPEDMTVGITELVYDRRRASVIFKAELDRLHLVLVRIHPTSFPAPSRYEILPALPLIPYDLGR